ncbi:MULTISPECIES: GntR family transcriptional regulator [Clostridium]|uniref:GntR family transcriptional regulator n=1 Tax=Clostridium TaxID=1485 RepID=UPI00241C2774|nr:GntR family transcriptional regulator [Clostridium sp. DMHC 10]
MEELEREILDGKFDYDKKLPTEEELMERFNVSRNTIRKAIEVLVGKGYIYQVHGSGVFLREFSKPGCVPMWDMSGLTRTFSKDKLTSRLLDLSLIEANDELAEKMKCKIHTKLYHVRRVRYMNDEPFTIEESFFNKDIILYLNEDICKKSIYDYIINDLKLKIKFADKIISCEKLNKDEALLLHLNEGDPSLIVENTVFLSNGTIFDFSREKYNYTRSKLLSLATL